MERDEEHMINYQVRYRKKLTLHGFVVVEERLVMEFYSTGFEMESYWIWKVVPAL